MQVSIKEQYMKKYMASAHRGYCALHTDHKERSLICSVNIYISVLILL